MDQWLHSTSSPLEVHTHKTLDVFETYGKKENKLKQLGRKYQTKGHIHLFGFGNKKKGNDKDKLLLLVWF